MSGERIKNTGDAKDLRDRYHVPKPKANNVTVHAGQASDHAMAGSGMDGFELDRGAMIRASGKLAELRAELTTQLGTAHDLAQPLKDGTSEVAEKMRRTYQDRAAPDAGVQAILRDYLAELETVQKAIVSSLRVYEHMDNQAVHDVLRARPGQVS